MDRTQEFIALSANDGRTFATGRSASPFVLKASNMFIQMTSFETLLQSLLENYIGYHRYLPETDKLSASVLTTEERSVFNKEVLLFISGMASEIKDLSKMLDDVSAISTSLQFQHNKQIVSSLLNRLSTFTAQFERMQQKQKTLAAPPYRLLQDLYHEASPIRDSDIDAIAIPSAVGGASEPTVVVSSSFAERYVDEIAPSAKMKVYRGIAAAHKEALLKEARILQVRFSDDAQESARMEREVGRISLLLTQFVGLVDSQSEVVGDIHGTAQRATASVKQAGTELQLTLTRTQSHQWSMVVLLLGLSVLVLLLDAVTP